MVVVLLILYRSLSYKFFKNSQFTYYDDPYFYLPFLLEHFSQACAGQQPDRIYQIPYIVGLQLILPGYTTIMSKKDKLFYQKALTMWIRSSEDGFIKGQWHNSIRAFSLWLFTERNLFFIIKFSWNIVGTEWC